MELSTIKGLNLKLIHFVYFLIGIFLIYQNCAPAPNQDAPTEVPGPEVSKGSIGSLDLSRPVVLSPESTALQIDLENGEILSSREASYVGQCLQPGFLGDLKQLIHGSSICKTDHDVAEDAICTMIYKFPYIEIFVTGLDKAMKLGEETSGCPEVTLGLCENNQALEALVGALAPDQHIGSCLSPD